MFDYILPLYEDHVMVITMDFLGNGQSQRVASFPSDLWIQQADQVIALLEHLKLSKVNVVGTSGGAWTAINAAIKRPVLIAKVVADSFDGRNLAPTFPQALIAERTAAKQDKDARAFYEWCQGADWEHVVDANTEALLSCAKLKEPLFCEPLSALQCPLLLVGSQQDTMCRKDIKEEYLALQQLHSNCQIHLFPCGGHPAILSNAEAFAEVVLKFLNLA